MIVLRSAQADEAKELAELQERSSVAAFGHIFPPDRCPFPREDVHARWAEALQDSSIRTIVAELDGERVAFASMRAEWLDALYVVPEFWGAGVAPAIHDRALELVGELGSKRCHLWVLEDNTRARRFYERRGWRQNGARRVVPWPPEPVEVGYTLDF
jgi:GNAT superfamily N-acetyltransferase